MKQKTAMMELIEKLEVQAELYELENLTVFTCINDTVRIAKQLLEKEKEQIIDAVDYGTLHFGDIAEDYYNEKFDK